MVFDIEQIKKIRKQLGLTQFQFAQHLGVSQSMIAKIESGRLDPTYSYVKKIESSVNRLTKQEGKEAKDLMNKKIISVKPETSAELIVRLLSKYGISQVPVLIGNRVVGLVTETQLLELKEGGVGNKKAKEIMTESPPVIAEKTRIETIISLLKFYPIIIVQHSGKIIGVITKADVINQILNVNFV